MSLLIGIPLMIVLLILKGLFSGSEIALVNADKIRLKHMAKKWAQRCRHGAQSI